MYVTGEHLTTNPALNRDLSYYNVLDYDQLRAEYLWTNLGVPVVFLPEISRGVGGDKAKEERILGSEGLPAAEHLAGMLWVHDVIPWNAYLNPKPIQWAGKAKQAFGWDDQTRFVGYWETEKLVKLEPVNERVKCSVFQRPGRALFVVMNNSDEAAQVTLRPDWQALGVAAPVALTDLYARQKPADEPQTDAAPLAVQNGAVTVTIKPRSFAALATP